MHTFRMLNFDHTFPRRGFGRATLIKTLLLVLFISWSQFGLSQPDAQDSCAFLFSISQKATFAAADNFSNTYLVTAGNAVEKYDSTGRYSARYTNNQLGHIRFLDASNPLKLLLWYADFQTLVFLDRSLTELGRLNLSEAGFPAVGCVASAWDGNLWLFDESLFKLYKLTPAGEKLVESESLHLFFMLGADIAEPSIRENSQNVFLGSSRAGILSFDQFGQGSQRVAPGTAWPEFEVSDRVLIRRQGDKIILSALGAFAQEKHVRLPKSALIPHASIWLSKKRLFVQVESGVELWRF